MLDDRTVWDLKSRMTNGSRMIKMNESRPPDKFLPTPYLYPENVSRMYPTISQLGLKLEI